MNRTIVSIGFWIALVTIVVNAVVVFASFRTIIGSNRWVEHTRQVIAEGEHVLSVLKDAETGQRGYLLTGRDEYLEPYRAARAEIDTALDKLRSLTSDNPAQKPRIADLQLTAADKLAELEQTLSLRRERGMEAALEVVNTDRGKRLMDRARAVVSDVQDEERRLLDDRTAASQAAVRRAVVAFGVTTGAGLLLLLVASSFVRREAFARQRAAEAILQERSWLSTTLTSIGDAVIATDGDGRVKFMNPVAEALTGWLQREAEGQPMGEVFRIINEETRRPAENPVERVIREGVIVGLANHTVLIAKDGTETPIEDSAAPIREGASDFIGVVMVFRDASKERRHEVALRAAKAEAEEANKAKDRFLAVLSHELRTPLNPILLAVTSMLDRPTPPEHVRPNLEMIRQNVNLQARLIDDLLDVMRIVQVKMPLHWEVADCHRLIEQSVQICRSEVFGKGLRLEMHLAAEKHHVNADPVRLQQVFWNLINNAVKFTPEGGTIKIRTRNHDCHDHDGDRLVIEVSDTGIGIEQNALPLIFDPFQQGETAITRRFGGLGLGLAICKGIVEGHGGVLTAESEGTGRGATFRIELRAMGETVAPATAQLPGEVTSPAASQPCRILVVEDEQATLKLMSRLLRGMGHQVTAAATVAMAREAVEAGEFDLIVSDIGLPDGSGLDLMRHVVALRGSIAAIALTGYGMEDDIERSRTAGFTAHLTKPIDFTKLDSMIRLLTGGDGEDRRAIGRSSPSHP